MKVYLDNLVAHFVFERVHSGVLDSYHVKSSVQNLDGEAGREETR
jgi:hypothetical protein